MLFCKNCGAEIKDAELTICPNCGKTLFVTPAPEKLINYTSLDSKTNDSGINLWSWLKKDSKRQLFYTDTEFGLDENQFAEKVAQKFIDNNVSAKIEKRNILWDNGVEKKEEFFIVPQTSVKNPISYLLQFNKIGKFSFVEEKSFITPPKLPDYPETPETSNNGKQAFSTALIGACMLILGIILSSFWDVRTLGVILIILGIIMLLISIGFIYSAVKTANMIQEYNYQLKKWNDAWKNWQDTIFIHSFQEDTNGQLSRIYDSCFACVKQVSEEEFGKTQVREEEESQNLNELEELISKRKEEYK